ncbi:MAG: Ryanodine receptor Ryr [Clostridia bacterium]|nr:Ryanodine receptor Ryr [Clostridia bacterium]
MYNPKPIDTSDVVLSDDIMELAEVLAKNTHEVWSAGRIKDGWKYGEKRNDDLKETPCLIPYEQLSELEKKYDRETALNTLKLIVKLGYKIEKTEL